MSHIGEARSYRRIADELRAEAASESDQTRARWLLGRADYYDAEADACWAAARAEWSDDDE